MKKIHFSASVEGRALHVRNRIGYIQDEDHVPSADEPSRLMIVGCVDPRIFNYCFYFRLRFPLLSLFCSTQNILTKSLSSQ